MGRRRSRGRSRSPIGNGASVKGLEADVVFLWGTESLPSRDEREVLYVGISRAKSRLTVVGTAESCQRLEAIRKPRNRCP